MKKKALFSLLCCSLGATAFADVTHYFSAIQYDPHALYAFLRAMPKGGELHYHLAGGAYPEVMLDLAATKPYCLDMTTDSVISGETCPTAMASHNLATNTDLYQRYLKAWSLKDFHSDKETAEEHFFAAFAKFMPIVAENEAQLLVDVLRRADAQNEQYMEILTIPDDAKSASFGALLKDQTTDAEKLALLQKNEAFKANVQLTVTKGHEILQQTRSLLGCDKKPEAKGCGVSLRFQYYILRQLPEDAFFAMSVNAFEVAQKSPDFVGINLVQQEDVPAALKPYKRQMQVLNFLHQQYPKVHISLHAGELSARNVSPADLRFHIHDAVMVGHAERIGHGVDIIHEDKADELLKTMAQKNIAVEVNLTSNAWLVNAKGPAHPLHYYLDHQVPVVLSTDDEGILRTDLTREYVKAVREQNLNYQDLKTITRNALTYSFLPGNSLWQDPKAFIPVVECQSYTAVACQKFLAANEKARLQKQLEDKLSKFEAGYL